MSRLWYPYDGFADAQARLCAFADATVGPACGVSFTAGGQITALRHPGTGSGGGGLWLNVLAQHVSRPVPSAAAPGDRFGRLKAWFEHVLAIEGQAEIDSAQAQMVAADAFETAVRKQVWMPVHEFMLRHKLAADTAGMALDTVGVVAAGVFIVVAAPELAAAGTVLATAGLVTGVLAALGSFALFAADGAPYMFDLAGNEAAAKRIEDDPAVQWVRICATIMLLPDIAVGGTRSLIEIGKLGEEGKNARLLESASSDAAAAARKRAAAIRHPERHPGPLNRRLHRANALEAAAMAHSRAAEEAIVKLRTIKYRDLYAFQGATLAGTALLTAAPPGVVMSEEQKQRDEQYEKSLLPEHGMPSDVRLEMRVTSHAESPK